eukprot:CAMPEP_0171279836 /NCGR_PEP_ID=MMETSP0790-20130122/65590_1 /TAXON_ID=2925 /ORGANISM="Alexandrium catenella, Strain OF101" /LENGTH=704 /DNA_ID=CAMNT_0011749037 /DNA_START=36 /DNA_END=2146 /DNA_ORIENTATION=-
MTPEEKAGQLSTFSDKIRLAALGINPDAGGGGPEKLLQMVREGKVGSLFNGIGAAKGREVQRVAVEESRLGIPLLFGADVIHGLFTVFPIPLGEAASFEPDLAERTARATAVEATAMGIQWTFAPMVDVARDQRWGRVAEGSGEDVHLGAELAKARVRGFQGPNLKADDSLLACPKHFAAYGGVSGGMDYNFVEVSEATLRDVHLPAFKASFDAGALTVMSAFNDVAGVPASGNRWLMTDVLRGEWNFTGFVVSDFTADLELIDHGYAADRRDAAKKALLAGLDVSMESNLYNEHLPDLLAKGEVPVAWVDELVRRVLRVKAAMGLFENPYRSLANRKFDVGAHHALAREAGKRSIVMLKNDGVLPLKKSGQRIALIGPYGADMKNLEGTWSLFGDKSRLLSVERGIRGALADADALTVGGLEEAVAAARQADVVLLAIGEPQNFSGEAQSRTQIVVPAAQQALAEAVAAAGKPVVVLLKTGRALALTGAVRNAEAILVTWFLGSQTGPAVADVLFGDYSPSGRLPVSFPQDAGQQPFFYNHPRTGRPQREGQPRDFKARYREVGNEALYPFGHGLGYTRFEYGTPTLSTSRLPWGQAVTVSATVRNVGERAAEEVVQLYVHDRVASRVRPVRELKGFRKVLIQAGASLDVAFELEPDALAFHGADGKRVIEPGMFDVWVSPSSSAGQPVSFELLAGPQQGASP